MPHAVLLEGGAAAYFAERIASLGGTVELLHEGAGIAIVAGLSDAGAISLETSSNVDLVIEDFEYQGASNPRRTWRVSRRYSLSSINIARALRL